MNVIQFPVHGKLELSKRELARHLGRSERWVELRVREGMPSLMSALGSRRFSLPDVQEWLTDRDAKGPRLTRLDVMELHLAQLEERVQRLERDER